jgi:hypothetical protein
MGSTEDPPDGGVVARTCLGAVVVYAVFYSLGNRANNRYFLHSVGVRLFCIGEPEQLSCGETCWTIEEIQALVFQYIYGCEREWSIIYGDNLSTIALALCEVDVLGSQNICLLGLPLNC